MATNLSSHNVRTIFPYLARSQLYNEEKPFASDFIPDISDKPLTNHIFNFNSLDVIDARASFDSFDLERNGFSFLKSGTAITTKTADDVAFVEKEYYKEVEATLHKAFPEYSRLECLDHQIRKRSPLFPQNPGASVKNAQPAVLPHSDFSTRGCFLAMEQFFPEQEQYYKDSDFDLLNAWRVLKGPNNDWPLSVCDYQSIDPSRDIICNDVLHEDCVGENWLLHESKFHAWYYLSDQDTDDLIVFRNADSKGKRSQGFHAAFDTVKANCQPRESIEVRVVAFR